jgi:nucleotide-binding universal stress UspA family protein
VVNVDGPIVFAYDGSPASRAAIALAGRHLRPGRDATVLTVYQPLESVPFFGDAGIVLPTGADEQIVMGTHGRTGVKSALLGSVATAVMHHAGLPVTVVPAAFV